MNMPLALTAETKAKADELLDLAQKLRVKALQLNRDACGYEDQARRLLFEEYQKETGD